MTNQNSVTERAAKLRKAYTGESRLQALNAIQTSVRGDVLEALRAMPELVDPELTRYIPRDGYGLLDKLRSAVLPNANSWQQELLDLFVLISLREFEHLPLSLRAEAADRSEVVASVSPHQDHLVVHCHPGMESTFLATLVATRSDNGRTRGDGLPCIRFKRKRQQVEVSLIGSRSHPEGARLKVPGVHQNAWNDLLEYIEYLDASRRLYRSPISDEPPGKVEEAALDKVLHWHRHHVMASKLARRIGLIAGSNILDAWAVSGGIYTVEFQSPWRRSIPEVAQKLRHPVAGFISLYPQFASSWSVHEYSTITVVEDGGEFPIRTSAGPDRGKTPVLQIRAIIGSQAAQTLPPVSNSRNGGRR
ncbi:hypothetical protein ACFQS3_06270 [Glycomyces mayteni]|uniref:Uncharacterized protein n=1 Tax=Glycomyces mayteni TaxID=543887 RepID=A0ABW2D6N9_9ACTN